jgi:KaiC/GvpD/RAD55 family RecA-like ATPase
MIPAQIPLQELPTDVEALDGITNSGLPKGRTTLVCGGTG